MARIKTRQFLLDSCIAFEHLLSRLLLPPPSWVILSHSFHRDTGFSYIDWKPHSQRSSCWTADNTIASNGFCSIVPTEGAFSVILLNPCICNPPLQITLRIGATACYSIPHLWGQPLWNFSMSFFSADPLSLQSWMECKANQHLVAEKSIKRPKKSLESMEWCSLISMLHVTCGKVQYMYSAEW